MAGRFFDKEFMDMECFSKYGIKHIILENGMKIVLKQMAGMEDVFVSLIVFCGPINETAGNNGISHFLEHLIYVGGSLAGKRSKPLYKIMRSGNDYDLETSAEFTAFSLDTVKKYFSRDLKLVFNSVGKLVFSKKDFLQEQRVIADEISNDSDDDGFSAAILERMFPHHPLRYFICGKKSTLHSFTPRKIRNWHRRFYQPQRMVLVVAADASLQQIVNLVKKSALMDLKNSDIKAPPPVKINWRAKSDIYNSNKNITRFIFPMPGNARDIFFFSCIIEILHDETIVGPHWRIARELGIYSTMHCRLYVNSYFCYLTLDLEGASQKLLKRLEKRFIVWIHKVSKDGFTPDILCRVYNIKLKEATRGLGSGRWWRGILAEAITERFVDDLDLYLNPANLSLAETKKEIERVFREYFLGKYLVFRGIS